MNDGRGAAAHDSCDESDDLDGACNDTDRESAEYYEGGELDEEEEEAVPEVILLFFVGIM